MYDELIDRLTTFFTADPYRNEVSDGKKEFFDEAGIMDEENQAFEMRMTQFLEWYLFTRPLRETELTPAQYALEARDFPIAPAEHPAFENLAASRNSLFEFLKIRGEDIHVRDLFLDKKIVIPNSPINIGFNRDEIFSARLIPDGESFHFSRSFCFHPSESGKYVLSEIKRLKKLESPVEQEALILKLMKMRYKYEQYRHLKLDYIYTNEKKVRF
jgi:hypothetical protein